MSDQSTEYRALPPDPFTAASEQGSSTPNPLLLIHRLLRGRYKFAVPLAILFALPAGYIGYNSTAPVYSSSGLIRVAPTLPRLLYRSDESDVPPMYDSFVATQAQFVQNRRVIDMALQRPEMREAGWPSGPQGVRELERNLRVQHQRRSELIGVSVQHPRPEMARVAVNAVLDSYHTLYGASGQISVTEQERQLQRLERDLRAELSERRETIVRLAEQYGADNLDLIHSSRVSERIELDRRISEIELQVIALGQGNDANGTGENDTPAEADARFVEQMSVRELARYDRYLANLLDQKDRLDAQRRSMTGFGPRHPVMRDLDRQIEASRIRIDERAEQLRTEFADRPPQVLADGGVPSGSVEQLGNMVARYRIQRERLNEEIAELNRTRMNIRREREREQDLVARLQDVTDRLQRLRVERENLAGGRITIEARGDIPVSPSRDRRKQLAVLAAGAGGGAGAGLVVLTGFLRRSYRYIDELEEGIGTETPVLGGLPVLHTGDPERDAAAALNIHHLRNIIQLRSRGAGKGRSRIYVITSPGAGDGKTSLTLALGVSFAAAGHRTVIVDADLIGRGLTRQLGMTKCEGVRECLRNGSINGELRQTGFDNLLALPVGIGEDSDAEQLSIERLQPLCDRLREDGDVILLDTGPVLGSLESNLVASLADDSILVVARGCGLHSLRTSIKRLREIGARCAGVVFNRADTGDLERSLSSLSMSHRTHSSERPQRRANRKRPRDPVVRALLGSVGQPSEGDGSR